MEKKLTKVGTDIVIGTMCTVFAYQGLKLAFKLVKVSDATEDDIKKSGLAYGAIIGWTYFVSSQSTTHTIDVSI